MEKQSRWSFRPGGETAPPATILIRLAVGGVFCASGLIKFLYANQGFSRFARLGIPAPDFLANIVGGVEIAAGLLLAVGLATRLATVPLVFTMLVAIVTTKLPLLFGTGPEPVAAAPRSGSGRSSTSPGSTSPCCWAASSCSWSGPGPGRSTPGGPPWCGDRAGESSITTRKIRTSSSLARSGAGRTRLTPDAQDRRSCQRLPDSLRVESEAGVAVGRQGGP